VLQFFLDLVERGAEVCGNEIPFQARFIVKPRLPTTAAPENPHFLNNTRFQFNEDSQRLDYGTAMSIEMKLIQDLLTAGYASWKGQYACAGEGYVADNQRQLVDNLRVLNLQRQEILQGDFENELTPRAPISPAQSPKGTTAAISALRATTSSFRPSTNVRRGRRFPNVFAVPPPYKQHAQPSIPGRHLCHKQSSQPHRLRYADQNKERSALLR
jgi:hypothetical protein